MPAYSYTSGDPIGITALNPSTGQFIEVIYPASGSTYSYSRIAWLPDIPINNQIMVFTRPNSMGPETAMIEGTDFVFGSSETVVFVNAPVGQVVLRRSTDLSKMILSYVDGAKFTSRQLNSTMHQLLFIAQEKANFGTNIFNYYPVSVVANTWSSATSYVVNDVVIHSGGIYVCIANNTNNNPSSSPLFWAFQNPQSNGFYVTGYNAPVNLHMGDMENGQTWVWSAAQKRFQSGFAINSSSNLSDYAITNPLNNQILEYSSNRWRNKTVQWAPTLTGPNLILSKHIYSSVLTSFADSDINLPSYLEGFNNPGLSAQVMPNAATVYHMLKETIPNGTDPKDYFTGISNSLDQALQNLKNPVKAKLYWDLAYGNQTQKTQNGVNLYGSYSSFWDAPEELYSPLGIGSVWKHAVADADTYTYTVTPWYSYRALTTTPATYLDIKSKVYGYGVSQFYLSLPDSTCSAFYIPVVKDDGNFTVLNDLSTASVFLSLGDHSTVSNSTPRDMYLVALRDMAFAGARPGTPTAPRTSQNVKDQDNNARVCKGRLILAEYDGFKDLLFKRLEQNETPENVLWKIPNNIIYYNRAALALANKEPENYISNLSTLRNTVRFQGYSSFAPNTTLAGQNTIKTNRNTSSKPMGYSFKADEYWSNWVTRWQSDVNSNYNFRFNEADIDWAVWHLTPTTTEHFDLYGSVIPSWQTINIQSSNSPTNTPIGSRHFFPWPFRPNQAKELLNEKFQVGSHLLNVDANKLFSESSTFVPDPVDTYVFRLVVNPTVTAAYFKEASPSTNPIIKSAILLEYGFRESGESNETTAINATNKSKLYPGFHSSVGNTHSENTKNKSRLNKNNVICRVISEQLEADITNPSELRYVAKIAITVPRLKSIGYSRIFRKFATTSTSNSYPAFNTGNTDVEIDSGPWSFNLTQGLQSYSTNNTTNTAQGNLIWPVDTGTNQSADSIVSYGTPTNQYASGINTPIAAGRNECAVKFTRLGIPSDMWLRVSVLNTDASVQLLNPSSLNFQGV